METNWHLDTLFRFDLVTGLWIIWFLREPLNHRLNKIHRRSVINWFVKFRVKSRDARREKFQADTSRKPPIQRAHKGQWKVRQMTQKKRKRKKLLQIINFIINCLKSWHKLLTLWRFYMICSAFNLCYLGPKWPCASPACRKWNLRSCSDVTEIPANSILHRSISTHNLNM